MSFSFPAATASSRLRLRVRRVEGAPIVALRVLLPGGARRESIPGQALLTGRMLAEGTTGRDFAAISADAEARGMILSSFGGYEGHGLALDGLVTDWRRALDWAAELVFESAFPETRLRWLARQAAAELEAQADEADVLTGREHMAQLWAPHPRSRPLQGDAASLERLQPSNCRDFHRAALSAGLLVSIAGDLSGEEVRAHAFSSFGAASEVEAHVPPFAVPADPASSPEPRRELRTHARDQAHLYLSHLTVSRAHPDYPALELAGVLLGAGSGLAGRIPQRIRDREGLAYTAMADAVAGASLDSGRLAVYVGTSPATVAAAEAAARDELARFVAEPIEALELADAKSYLLGREPFRRETARQWADLLAASLLLDLPLDDPDWHAARVAALTAVDVEGAVRRHLDPLKLVATVGLPA